jgi:dolichyl-phosphate beta-glucosyltransferase
MIVLSSQALHAPPSPAGYVRRAVLAAQRLAPSVAGLAATDHELTVIIPAYNEQSRLPNSLAILADFLDASKIDYRVLVADDGSHDHTARATDSLGPRFSTLSLARHGGKGCAVRMAMLAATGQVVAFTDADVPYDLQALRQGYDWLRENQCEVVFGDRSDSQSGAVVERRFVRKVATATFKEIVKRLVSSELSDTQCGLKLFSRRAAIEIFSRARVDGFAFDAEVVMLALRLSLRCRRLSVKLVNEHASTVSLVRDALPMLLDIIRVRLRLGRQPLMARFGEGWGRLPSDRPQLAA